MKRYTLLIIFAATLALSLASHAQQQTEQWFEQANSAYNAGNYDSALVLYNHIVEYNMESVALYYNMGNTYYKKRDYPMAIYCYEKALKINPVNEEVQANLAIANLAIVDKIEPLPQSFIQKGWNRLKYAMSEQQWAVLSIVAFALVLASLFLFLRSRRMSLRKLGFFCGLALVVVLGLSVVCASRLKQYASTENQAIIMNPTVTVKSTPNEASVDLFVLHEGAKVEILDHAEGWNKIKIANGSIGWLKDDSMLPF